MASGHHAMTTSNHLSAADVERYRERGILLPGTGAAVHRGRRACTRATPPTPIACSGRKNQKPHLLFPWLNELVRDPRILDAVENVLGPNILCWSCAVLHEAAGDATFVSLAPGRDLLGPVAARRHHRVGRLHAKRTALSGCMRVVPGTHRAQLPHDDTFKDNNLLSRGQEIAVRSTKTRSSTSSCSRARCRCTMCCSSTAPSPTAPHPRIGFAIRYLPTDVRQIPPRPTAPRWCAASTRIGYFEPEQPPEDDLHPARWRGTTAGHGPPASHSLRRRAQARGKLGTARR